MQEFCQKYLKLFLLLRIMKRRLLQIVDYLGMSVRAFEVDCELQRGNISNMSESGAIGSDKLAKIIDKHPEINAEWLITGKGAMCKNNQSIGNIDKSSVIGANVNGNGINIHGASSELVDVIRQQQEQINKLIEVINKLSDK